MTEAENTKQYHRAESVRINRCGAAFRGGWHIRETLLTRERDIVQDVVSSPFVFLEYFEEINFPSAVRIAQGEKLSKVLKASEDMGFFSGIAGLAGKYGKDVIVVNPQKYEDLMFSIWDSNTPNIAASVASLAAFTVMARAIKSNRAITRGKLLRIGIPAVALSAVGAISMFDRLSENLEGAQQDVEIYGELDKNRETGHSTRPLDPNKIHSTSWNWRDWRDASSAVGTRVAMDAFKNEWIDRDAAMFYGALHREMLPYLQNIEAAQARRKLYPHFAFSAENTVRRYHFTGRDWKVSKIPY